MLFNCLYSTKVHAQRKFAQGSNINSPIIASVKEIENQEGTKPDILPELADLLSTDRPNTEDFLTFLCFRGTPILPPSLNFFATASTTNSNLKPQEPTGELNNGPIATEPAVKFVSGVSERPFIAFGVRKRADPIIISKQMDKKRRHALALQALRRKYQEQRLAKIRAVTISALTEKLQNKPLIRTTRSVSRNEIVAKKGTPVKLKQKINERLKIIKRTINETSKSDKPQMCLRSYRGRLTHHELKFKSFRRKNVSHDDLVRPLQIRKSKMEPSSDFSSDDDQPLVGSIKKVKSPCRVAKKSFKKPPEVR